MTARKLSVSANTSTCILLKIYYFGIITLKKIPPNIVTANTGCFKINVHYSNAIFFYGKERKILVLRKRFTSARIAFEIQSTLGNPAPVAQMAMETIKTRPKILEKRLDHIGATFKNLIT